MATLYEDRDETLGGLWFDVWALAGFAAAMSLIWIVVLSVIHLQHASFRESGVTETATVAWVERVNPGAPAPTRYIGTIDFEDSEATSTVDVYKSNYDLFRDGRLDTIQVVVVDGNRENARLASQVERSGNSTTIAFLSALFVLFAAIAASGHRTMQREGPSRITERRSLNQNRPRPSKTVDQSPAEVKLSPVTGAHKRASRVSRPVVSARRPRPNETLGSTWSLAPAIHWRKVESKIAMGEPIGPREERALQQWRRLYRDFPNPSAQVQRSFGAARLLDGRGRY